MLKSIDQRNPKNKGYRIFKKQCRKNFKKSIPTAEAD